MASIKKKGGASGRVQPENWTEVESLRSLNYANKKDDFSVTINQP
jgi:hypothetical protein